MDEENVKIRRAREAIKHKMRAGDYIGARTLILEALKVFPTLDPASGMLTVCEILCSTLMELPGFGVDWYWVLQLLASASPAAIEARYQKIVTELNLIKNDCPGTELALNFAANAFSILSDPIKRAEFDSKRSTFEGLSQYYNSVSSSRLKRAAGEVYSGNGDIKENPKRKSCDLEASCVANQANFLDNINLQKALGVSEKSPAARKRQEDFYDFENSRKPEHFSEGQIWAAYDQENMPRRYCKIDKIIGQKLQIYVAWYKASPCQSFEKNWQDAGFQIPCGTFALEMNRMTLTRASMFSYMLFDGITKELLEIYPKKGEVWAIYKDWDKEWCSNPAEMRKKCAFGIVEILADFVEGSGAKVAYLVRVQGFNNVFQRHYRRGTELSFQIPCDKLLMFSHKISAFRFISRELSGISNGMLELDPLAIPDNLVQDFSIAVGFVDLTSQSDEEKDCSDDASITHLMNPSASTVDTGGSNSRPETQKVKLTPQDFVQDQVWAVYDDYDAMPRSYVKINYVFLSPITVSVTFLEPHPMHKKEIEWVEEGLPVVCGIFRATKSASNLEVSKFSHLAHCERISKGSFYEIFPRKGEIWAMYTNWNVDRKSSSRDVYQCRVVEILSDFSEENGMGICSLAQVQGCFFQRQMHDGFLLTKEISKFELLSFSHRIPVCTVNGIEHTEIPKGSLELEPDALPPNLISLKAA